MTTEEGNKILMEFLQTKHKVNTVLWESFGFSFHNDWQLLMKVVDKIESLNGGHHGRFVVHISSNTCSIQGTNLHKCLESNSNYPAVYMSDPNAIFPTKIESTWYNLIKFIQWYEANKFGSKKFKPMPK